MLKAKSALSFAKKFSPLAANKKPGLAIKLGGGAAGGFGASSSTKPSAAAVGGVRKSASAAAAFSADGDSDSDEEEIPAEARMRMRNVGRETITSAGPNSFGKTKQGFIDANKLFERQLQEKMDKVGGK